jgi:hypothetical protein
MEVNIAVTILITKPTSSSRVLKIKCLSSHIRHSISDCKIAASRGSAGEAARICDIKAGKNDGVPSLAAVVESASGATMRIICKLSKIS